MLLRDGELCKTKKGFRLSILRLSNLLIELVWDVRLAVLVNFRLMFVTANDLISALLVLQDEIGHPIHPLAHRISSITLIERIACVERI